MVERISVSHAHTGLRTNDTLNLEKTERITHVNNSFNIRKMKKEEDEEEERKKMRRMSQKREMKEG